MFQAYVIPGQSDGHNIGYRVQLCDGLISRYYGPVFTTEEDAWRFHGYCLHNFEGTIKKWWSNVYSRIDQDMELDSFDFCW